MAYVDGFVLPLPRDNVEVYRRMASAAGAIWREHGALQYQECIAEDVKSGHVTSFPQSVQLRPDEIVVFAWITFESRAHRDEVNAKVQKDPRLAQMMCSTSPPFDASRMIYGGFETLVQL